ncbi:related to transthyretin-like protein pucM [Rhynchosporium secalis]|uniref:Related to transthyretin-like protein pucM n=1 Tax=Rhynchosporium secalis TaxID=38038 RepID=A0A1E1MWF6_RHYSE|nr:related to transthyretin-like protein pucM [Rhynchosporium secalis]
MSTTAPARPPITCHVLDTTTGRPASSLSITLTCTSVPDIEFTGTTNHDGRITAWAKTLGPKGDKGSYVREKTVEKGGVSEALRAMIDEQGADSGDASRPAGSSLWKLRFDTGAHYGIENTFFPVVELSFLVNKEEHFHVPLLLGPHSFTTYRGS